MSDKKDKDKKKDKSSAAAAAATADSSKKDSVGKPIKEKKEKEKFIPEEKLDSIYSNLDSNKYTSLSFKTKFPTDTSKLFKHAKKSTTLTALELVGAGTTPVNIKEIIQLLELPHSLTYLRISDHALDPQCLAQLGASLKNVKVLSTLCLDSPHRPVEMHPAAHALAKGLSENASITTFRMTGHALRDQSASSFSALLARNNKLLLLDLSNNPISEEGILTLCKGVAHNTTLKALVLDSMLIGSDKWASPLVKTLTQHNTVLNRLDLNRNNLQGIAPMTEFFAALEATKSLTFLQLNETNMGNEGAAVLFRHICQNPPLRRLHIADNGITKLDVNWEQISVLTELNISGNPLDEWSLRRLIRGMGSNRSLSTLNLQRCGVTDELIKEATRELSSNMSMTNLSVREDDEGRTAFDATTQKLFERNASLRSALEAHLKASPAEQENTLKTLAFNLGPQIVYLSNLNLQNNLPNPVKQLLNSPDAQKANTLLMYRNVLTEVPAHAIQTFRYWRLSTLDMSGNQLQSVPPELGRMITLTKLDLHDNRIADLPPQLGHLTRLAHLLLRNNRITSLPSFVIANCPLETLSLEANPISPAAEVVYRLWTAEKLDLSGWNLNSLPVETTGMPKLKELHLSNNNLISLPHEISQLTNLTLIDLSNNKIQNLPWHMCELTALKSLRLSGNPLSTLPEEHRVASPDMPKLREYLASLKKTSAPCHRAKLMVLGVDGAGKSALVKAITALGVQAPTAVAVPLTSSSSGSSVASAIAVSKEAVNPIATSRRHASSELEREAGTPQAPEGSPAVPLKTSLNVPAPNVTRSPSLDGRGTTSRRKNQTIMSVGSGDTSLTGAYRSAQQIDLTTSTVTLRPENTNGPDQQFEVWDFAGDELYNPSHAFMISKRSVYLLVFNAVEPLDAQYRTLDYWMAVISSRAKGCAVLLVGTHADSRRLTTEQSEAVRLQLDARYSPRFPEVHTQMVFCSGKNGKNISGLVESITTAAAKLQGMGRPVPDVFVTLEYQLRHMAHALSPPIISTDKFTQIAETCGAKKANVANTLQVLSELGVIVFVKGAGSLELTSSAFQRRMLKSDGQSEALEAGLIVLDALWMSQLFRSLVVVRDQYLKNGVLHRKDADHIWRPPLHPAGVATVYLELLDKFEMTFPLSRVYRDEGAAIDPQAADKFLVPMLLPADPPQNFDPIAFLKKDPDVLVFSRIYQLDFMPQGLFAQLLTRALTLAAPVQYWRSGVVVAHSKSRTAAALTTDNVTTVKISATGPSAARMLLHLDNALTAMMTHIFLVRAETFAMCTCPGCRDSDRGFRWKVADLATAYLQSNQLMFKCGTTGSELSLKSLAPDISLILALTLDFANVKMGKELGSGAFSTVYEGVYMPSKVPVAVKKLIFQETGKTQAAENLLHVFNEFRQEAYTWSRLHHPNILQLVGVTINPLCFVIELASLGTLHSYLQKNEKLAWPAKIAMALGTAKGLHYLHTLEPPIIHRDIKSHNILLASPGDNPDAIVSKLADFGTCFSGHTTVGRVVDNPVWLAPEVMVGKDYGVQVDIYSFGIVMWEISASAKEPFAEFNIQFTSVMEDQILAGLRPTIPESTPVGFAKLMERCWCAQPTSRPSAQEAVQTLETLKI